MKNIVCTLQGGYLFENAEELAKQFCIAHDLFPTSVKKHDSVTMEFEFSEVWKDDWIMRVLTTLFQGLGGVEVGWDIFDEPVLIC